MRGRSILKKVLSSIIVCCFLSSALFSRALALEEGENLSCGAVSKPAFEELFEHMVSLASGNNEACIDEQDLEGIRVVTADVPGLIVLYTIFMFIYYGRLCLETLDPAPCRAMVSHLFWALFLGVLFESF